MLFTGLNLFLWTRVLQQRQRDELNAIGIQKCMSISIQHGTPHTSHFAVEQLRTRDAEHDIRA